MATVATAFLVMILLPLLSGCGGDERQAKASYFRR
jgi:hypothetical protein